QRLLEEYRHASPEDRKRLVGYLLDSLWEGFRKTAVNVVKTNNVRKTSVVDTMGTNFLNKFAGDSVNESTSSHKPLNSACPTLNSFKSLATTAMHNAFIDKLRAAKKFASVPVDEEGQPIMERTVDDKHGDIFAEDSIDQFYNVILPKILGPSDIELWNLRFVQKNTYAKIAEILGTGRTPDSIRAQCQRILQKIENSFEVRQLLASWDISLPPRD
ncbi:MAG: sigma-70 family RNA polymerase sigma factor, partial [Planctomycetia bacterium]|nr:sigma-70 family RNA polymerase sigma factor [Planctomycetia bacterium]